ncbi:transporter, partial [Rubrivivax gelatinosus]|nr:transporter [Rubrivivax gelatinosus]
MQPGTVGIVLAAAAAHAVWNLASKYKREDTLLFVWAYTGASALLCVPLGLALVATGRQALDWHLVVGCAVSAGLHIVYSLTLQAGYDRADLGVVYPVARGTGPMLTMLLAVLLLGERLGPVAVGGALLIVAGILVVSGSPFGSKSRHPLQGLLWGAATGATIAAYTLWDNYSVRSWHLAPVSYYAGTLALQSLILTATVLRRRHRMAAA